MYNHQPKKYQQRTNLTFVHGEIKKTIESIFYQEKSYGWNYQNRKIELEKFLLALGLPSIFEGVHTQKNDRVKSLLSLQFNHDKNEVVLTTHLVYPNQVDQTLHETAKDKIIDFILSLKINDTVRVIIKEDMKRIRRDAPSRVFKILNFKCKDGHMALLSDYDFTRATFAISKEKAQEIGEKLAGDYKHEIHEFIRIHHSDKNVNPMKLVNDTLANWARVY